MTPLRLCGMKAAQGVHVEWVQDEAVVLQPGSGDLHYLNQQAALVLALIQELGYEAAIGELHSRFPDAETLESDIDELTSDLLEKGILVED